MRHIRLTLAMFAVAMTLIANAAPAMARDGGDDDCWWNWGWFISCDDDEHHNEGDDHGHRGGAGVATTGGS